VELARTSGKTIPELAQDLGVSGQTLRNWLHQADVDAGHGRPGELSTAEQQELRRLRRDNHTARAGPMAPHGSMPSCARTMASAVAASASPG
jgi:transposase-like protein